MFISHFFPPWKLKTYRFVLVLSFIQIANVHVYSILPYTNVNCICIIVLSVYMFSGTHCGLVLKLIELSCINKGITKVFRLIVVLHYLNYLSQDLLIRNRTEDLLVARDCFQLLLLLQQRRRVKNHYAWLLGLQKKGFIIEPIPTVTKNFHFKVYLKIYISAEITPMLSSFF